jgi:hypothetical protein
MKKTFKEFIAEAPRYKKLYQIREVQYLFEAIFSRDDVIIMMIQESERNKPALEGCVEEVESYCLSLTPNAFDIQSHFCRQAIGRMIKSVLEPFGYTKYGEKRLSKRNGGIITSASTYKKTISATLCVLSHIGLVPPKATLEDFTHKYPYYNKMCDHTEAHFIFNYILSKDQNIIAMIQATNKGIPALSVCIQEIEAYYQLQHSVYIDLKKIKFRQMLGAMVCCILMKFGYEKDHSSILNLSFSSMFKTAMVYKKID